jgi:hypothetical protein
MTDGQVGALCVFVLLVIAGFIWAIVDDTRTRKRQYEEAFAAAQKAAAAAAQPKPLITLPPAEPGEVLVSIDAWPPELRQKLSALLPGTTRLSVAQLDAATATVCGLSACAERLVRAEAAMTQTGTALDLAVQTAALVSGSRKA